MSDFKVNPKILISEYFDSLINRVDIQTEEQLEKFTSKSTRLNPDKASGNKTINVWHYLNGMREKMIKKISEAQADALSKLDAIRKDIEKDEEIYEKVFANRFFFLIQINNSQPSLFSSKIILIETCFYVNESQMIILK